MLKRLKVFFHHGQPLQNPNPQGQILNVLPDAVIANENQSPGA